MADVKAERRPDYFLVGSRPISRLEVHERATAFAPLALRLSLAAIFIAHGAQKLLGISAAIVAFQQMGFSPGALWAPVTALIELLSGLALVAGVYTRLAALLLLLTQLVAVFVVHLPNGFFLKPGAPGFEYNLALIGALLALVFLGSGKIGVDEALRRHRGRTVYRERMVTPGDGASSHTSSTHSSSDRTTHQTPPPTSGAP